MPQRETTVPHWCACGPWVSGSCWDRRGIAAAAEPEHVPRRKQWAMAVRAAWAATWTLLVLVAIGLLFVVLELAGQAIRWRLVHEFTP